MTLGRTRRQHHFHSGAITALILLVLSSLSRASELSDDLVARRNRVMARLDADAMLILWSAPTQRYSADIDYEYRQDSNLYYLTGVLQEGTILVLMPGNVSHREVLFIKDRDPLREHWEGRRLSAEEAKRLTAIETVLPTSQFEPVVTALLAGRSIRIFDTPAWASFLCSISRTLRSAVRYCAYSRLFAYHLEFQSLEIPRRMPVG